MNGNEDHDVEQDEERGHGEGLEVGEEAVLDHVEVVLVLLLDSALIVQVGNFDGLHWGNEG